MIDDFALSNFLYRKNALDADRPSSFRLRDRTWDLLGGVFAPVYTQATALFSEWLPYPAGGTFLEVGSGTGVITVTAALSGCASVTAVDITQAAVDNTRLNVERHGVGDRVRVLRSDMLTAVGAGETFDLIFWNSNFVEAPPDFVNTEDLHHALFDPGYAAHRAFLEQAPRHLAPAGRVLLGFSNLGNRDLLDALADRQGLTVGLLRSQPQAGTPIEHQLLELRRHAER
jgi:release factor glutamine methyltransferase